MHKLYTTSGVGDPKVVLTITKAMASTGHELSLRKLPPLSQVIYARQALPFDPRYSNFLFEFMKLDFSIFHNGNEAIVSA